MGRAALPWRFDARHRMLDINVLDDVAVDVMCGGWGLRNVERCNLQK